MARSRNIKPGFFLNEDLVELPFSTRLLFIGLWTIADREGRLDDRPKKIKMAIFPADDVDVEKGLSELHGAGMVLRYVVDNEHYIQICNFTKHQNPHVNEQDSTIPAPDLHCACTVPATPLTSSLIPDSPLPITDAIAPAPKVGRNKGSRCPDNFVVTDQMVEWFNKKGFTFQESIETEKFINHWTSKTGQSAIKSDWTAAWRNWMLNAQEYKGGFPTNGKRPKTLSEEEQAARDAVTRGREMYYASFQRNS